MSENVAIYNPDSSDFSVKYDINNDGVPFTYTIGAKQAQKFTKEVADHIANHLGKHLVFKRGIQQNFDDDYKNVLKEIYI